MRLLQFKGLQVASKGLDAQVVIHSLLRCYHTICIEFQETARKEDKKHMAIKKGAHRFEKEGECVEQQRDGLCGQAKTSLQALLLLCREWRRLSVKQRYWVPQKGDLVEILSPCLLAIKQLSWCCRKKAI